jgi:hypothetical protein
MSAHVTPPPKGFFRKAERVMVGAVMTVAAFVLEKVVIRTIKQEKASGGDPMAAARPQRRNKGRGGTGEIDVDLDEQLRGESPKR